MPPPPPAPPADVPILIAVAEPAPAPASPAELPKTGSLLPLIGLLGSLLLLASLGLKAIRCTFWELRGSRPLFYRISRTHFPFLTNEAAMDARLWWKVATLGNVADFRTLTWPAARVEGSIRDLMIYAGWPLSSGYQVIPHCVLNQLSTAFGVE